MREVLIGFDSAWTNNLRNPGAIAACVLEGGQFVIFHSPHLATFEDASRLVKNLSARADYVLIAIDQPTIVPNQNGSRPVDRVAASLVSKLGGGVQPARRGGLGAPMFGDGAPVWKFLATVCAVQNPIEARGATVGRYLIEVFPALALPALVPAIWQRRRAAKYNPVARKFDLSDWALVASGVATFARALGAVDLADWAKQEGDRQLPRKADQDRLDAVICLSIALAWRCGPSIDTLLIGDARTGAIATIVSAPTRAILTQAAAKQNVAVDQTWNDITVAVSAMPKVVHLLPVKLLATQADKSLGNDAIRIDPVILRGLLIDRARSGCPIEYGEVATAFGHRWSQGFGSSLKCALAGLATENRRSGEPTLMCLVVNKATRRPGRGFYDAIGQSGADDAMRKSLFDAEVERCRDWQWA